LLLQIMFAVHAAGVSISCHAVAPIGPKGPSNLRTFPKMTLENFPIFFYNKKKSINEQRRSFYETA
jgi:hypothetical protein